MISIVVPTFNEKENIFLLIERIIGIMKKHSYSFEIVVVDDNSPDKTGELLKKKYIHNLHIHVYIRTSKKGLSTAILHGIKKSKGNVIIGMDADFNHPPELIPTLAKSLKESDIVIASRFIRGGGMNEKGRYIGTYSFNLFLKYILGFPTMDNMSGYYAIWRKKLFSLNLSEIFQGYGEYHLRLLWEASQIKMKIHEIPVFYNKRIYGKSKSHLFEMFFSYLWCAIKLRLKTIVTGIV